VLAVRHIGRKFYHFWGGIGLLSLYDFLGRDQALIFYASLALIALGIDILRLKIPAINRFIQKEFSSFIRSNEEHKLTGTVPYILGIGISLYLYPTEIAMAAVCFLVFGDVAATAIGERYGRTKIGDKSLEGTAAFIVAALASGFLLSIVGINVRPGITAFGVLVAAGVEILPLPVNDNFAIPVLSGGAMALLASCLRGV